MPRSSKLEKQNLQSIEQGIDDINSRLETFVFVQSANLATWTIQHDLDKLYPSVLVKNDSNETVVGEVNAINNDNLEIVFNQPLTGTAYINI